MPQPLSVTVTTAASSCRYIRTRIVPPSGVNFTALESRLFHTMSSRSSSLHKIRSWSSSTSSSMRFSSSSVS